MKSAYELAMERLNRSAPIQKLTAAQRRQLAEIDSVYAAKLAERELALKADIDALEAAGNPDAAQPLRERLKAERAQIEATREQKKEDIRQRAA
jgi:hypothetical protein